MTYEVPYWEYREHVDNYVSSFRHPISIKPVNNDNNLMCIEDGDVLVKLNNGVDKLVFKDKEHFLMWVIKWA